VKSVSVKLKIAELDSQVLRW